MKTKLLEWMARLNDDMKWAIEKLSSFSEEEIKTPPIPTEQLSLNGFKDIPNKIKNQMKLAPLTNGKGGSDIGKSPDLSSKYVLLYFNAIYQMFLQRGQRYWCVPLVIVRLAPELKKNDILCQIIWSNYNPIEQWYTYVNHISNQLFDLGLAERYEDKKGVMWYRWTDEFLNDWLSTNANISDFFIICKRWGVKDSSGIVGISGFGLPPAHQLLRMF